MFGYIRDLLLMNEEQKLIARLKNALLLDVFVRIRVCIHYIYCTEYTIRAALNAYGTTRTVEYLTDIIAIRLESIGFK